MSAEMVDTDQLQRPEQDIALRRRLWDWRTRQGWSRHAAGKKMGMSDSGLQNYEYGRRKLSNVTVMRWVMSLQLSPLFHDVIAHLFMPGLVNIAYGAWPPKISPAYRKFVDSQIYPTLLLRSPDQGVLACNKEVLRTSPWLGEVDETADQPLSMVEAMFTPQARETYINWYQVARLTVFMVRQRCEGVMDDRLAELRAKLADQPEFEEMWNAHLSLAELQDNRTVLRDPDTGDIVTYETYVFEHKFPERDAGCLVSLFPVERVPAAQYRPALPD